MNPGRMARNNSGVVFITILMITMVLTVFTLGIASINVSQATFTKKAVDESVVSQFSQGTIAVVTTSLDSGGTTSTVTTSQDGHYIYCTPEDNSGTFSINCNKT